MKLFYRKYGQGKPIIILHGLFGQCDNWQTQAKAFAEKGFEVYTVDQRNHGLSPHSDEFNYKVMSADLDELITDLGFNKAIVLGHSMGGKTVMQFAVDHPEKINKLVVADIAPKYLPPHQQDVLAALQSVDFSIIKTRREVEELLSQHLTDFGTKQFLLKNVFWKTDTQLDWRFNLKAIVKNIDEIGAEITFTKVYTKEDFDTLFIRGERSDYILDSDIPDIRSYFPDAYFATIEGAGHWLHADKPKEFVAEVLRFIEN
jgi:esterase